MDQRIRCIAALDETALGMLFSVAKLHEILAAGEDPLPARIVREVCSSVILAAYPDTAAFRTAIQQLLDRLLRVCSNAATRAAGHVEQQLQQKRHLCWCVPRIRKCLRCNGDLHADAVVGRSCTFYAPFELGRPGTQYVKFCNTCGLVYDSEGYQSAADYINKPSGVKIPLPAMHRHPKWVRVSSETVISTDYGILYNGLFQSGHMSFLGMERASNYVAMKRHEEATGAARWPPLSPQQHIATSTLL